jgi:hypothetical protein
MAGFSNHGFPTGYAKEKAYSKKKRGTFGKFCNQCWIVSNLKVTTYNDGYGTVIPYETASYNANWGTLPSGALTSYPGATV